MMKAEFEEMIGKSVVDEEYKVIEAVYTWHPAINDTTGKDQMKTLYTQFGFGVIRGMLPVAEKMEKLDGERRELLAQLDTIKIREGQVDKAYELAEKVIEARPTEEKRVSKLCERYSRRLAQNINKDIQIGMMCPSVMISGAGNFPVKKKEKQVAAWDKNHEDYKEVEAILGKIEAIFYGKDVIKSDDENAIEKLQDKVDGLREDQERMKQANKAIRMKDKEKGDATLHDMGYTDEQIAQLREPDFCGRIGFPDYMLANNNANIRRLEGRIKSLQKTKSQGTQESENKFFKVKENVEAMRIQLFFEGKPEPEVRDILKSNGFRWAPSVGAWQRQLNNNGKYAVERVIRELEEMEAAE